MRRRRRRRPAQRVLSRTVLDAGEDYAIRIQEFDTRFKGRISDELKWRVDVWGLRRRGERQVNKLGHCFNQSNAGLAGQPSFNPAVTGNRCHMMAQSAAHRLDDHRGRAGAGGPTRHRHRRILAHDARLRQ